MFLRSEPAAGFSPIVSTRSIDRYHGGTPADTCTGRGRVSVFTRCRHNSDGACAHCGIAVQSVGEGKKIKAARLHDTLPRNLRHFDDPPLSSMKIIFLLSLSFFFFHLWSTPRKGGISRRKRLWKIPFIPLPGRVFKVENN